MSKEIVITSLEELESDYKVIYLEVIEQFKEGKRKLKNFELDYCIIKNGEFTCTLSSGIAADLEIFEMTGEIDDDEIVVFNSDFKKENESLEDLYDVDGYREVYSESDNDYDDF